MSKVKDYEGYAWVKVKRYTPDENTTWQQRFEALQEHHIKETSFLIEEVRKLAKELDDKDKS